MKHILIDARLYGPRHTGLGRYTKNLLMALKDLPDFKKCRFTLLVYPELEEEIKKDLGDNFSYLPTNLRHYSLAEQLKLPFLLHSLKPDLVHFTHLDKPILYFGPSAVTIHDLIRHFSKGPETTTKNPFLYYFKYLGYLLMTRLILLNSFIIVPSRFWQNFVIKKYALPPKKIITTHEAVDPAFLQKYRFTPKSAKTTKKYLLYTGNLYPHKNIELIFKALPFLPEFSLKIICARSVFTDKLQAKLKRLNLTKQVHFLGFVPDKDFPRLYRHAFALIHPSFLEGFSLTGLEAMALHCPVLAAKSSCLPEIYGPAALYFDPKNPQSLVSQIKTLQSQTSLRHQLLKLGHSQVRLYSWQKTAQKTLNFYRHILDQKT